MVFSSSNIKRKNNNFSRAKINIDLPTLNILCRYILQDVRLLRMEHLVNLRKLFNVIDRTTYENDPEKVKRIDFIFKALEARLDNNLTDRELILNYINGGIQFNIEFLDYDNLVMEKYDITYCNGIVEELLKYSFVYEKIDDFQDIIAQFKSSDISKRKPIIEALESLVNDAKNEFRKSHIEDNLNDVTFSLEDGTFESAVTDTYNLITNPSRRLFTGMQGLNEMIGGGFESGRVYMFLGVAGVGKSLTLLNLINQIKRYNTHVSPKDPTKTPCIVLLTMENTVVETITRLFDMVVDNSHGMANYSLNDVLFKLRNEGSLRITDSSPLDIVIKYKPNRSISTDYLYTLYDDLIDIGKEPVCFIQDHIKRIKSIDGNQELRIELGDIVNEFKVFSAEKDIPFITVSHLNREATKIIEEATRKGNKDSGMLLGKSSIGESLLMIDNLDCGMTISRDYDSNGQMYMTFHRIKMRDKGSVRDYIAQPFLPDNPIRLVEDFGGIPQFRESLNNLAGVEMQGSNSQVKKDSAAIISDMISTEKYDPDDNAFSTTKQTYNLASQPMEANSSSLEFMSQVDDIADGLSEAIIEANERFEEIKNRMGECPFVFISENQNYVSPAIVIDKSLINNCI